MLKNYN